MYTEPKKRVHLYPCTIVGYIRLILLGIAIAWHIISMAMNHAQAMRLGVGLLIALSLLLDLLDGYLARKFGHMTQFGILFDLAIDLITHTFVWLISGFYLAELFIILEWTTGLYIVAFSVKPNGHWKQTFTSKGSLFLKLYFSRNQRNILSAYGNIGHFLFPITLYLNNLPVWISYGALPGLIIYELATLWMFWMLLNILASGDS